MFFLYKIIVKKGYVASELKELAEKVKKRETFLEAKKQIRFAKENTKHNKHYDWAGDFDGLNYNLSLANQLRLKRAYSSALNVLNSTYKEFEKKLKM